MQFASVAALPALQSHFQPIVSLSHRRAVGHEALLRATEPATGRPLSPLHLFASLDADGQHALDRQAMQTHLHQFAAQREAIGGQHWLFVNLRPTTFLQWMATSRAAFADVLRTGGCAPSDVVIEITEEMAAAGESLEAAAGQARELGCLLALDDFGAGHSNFDRVWRLKPDIVKLDRSLVQRGARDPRAARVIGQMVSLLHECSALVLMEGIETDEEAQLALACDVDLVQGYLFGRPQPALVPDEVAAPQLAALWQRFHLRSDDALQADRQRLRPYLDAVEQAAASLRAGAAPAQACARFLELPHAQLCYQLDEQGMQHHDSLRAPAFAARGDRARFAPLLETSRACWARRPYFRRALAKPGVVQVTRPYLTIQGAGLSVTVSVAVRCDDRWVVVCGDVDWSH